MINFESCFEIASGILMEGALAERLKREHQIVFDQHIAMAGLIYKQDAKRAIVNIYNQYIGTAEKYHLPLMITTPTRRANSERIQQTEFSEGIIKDNVEFFRSMVDGSKTPIYVGGLMGCKGDPYKVDIVLSENEAFLFHHWQASLFREAGADFLFAGIMPALPEAIGMARAMERTGLPYIMSFLLRNTGHLLDGSTLHEAISAIESKTIRRPLCYMTNCIHPVNLRQALSVPVNQTLLVKKRFLGIQANACSLSPEELDEADNLKTTDTNNLGEAISELSKYCTLKILGGCCGTDHSHLEEIAKILNQNA